MRFKAAGHISCRHQSGQDGIFLAKMQLATINAQRIVDSIVFKIGFFEVQQYAIGKADGANAQVCNCLVGNDSSGGAEVCVSKIRRRPCHRRSDWRAPTDGISGHDFILGNSRALLCCQENLRPIHLAEPKCKFGSDRCLCYKRAYLSPQQLAIFVRVVHVLIQIDQGVCNCSTRFGTFIFGGIFILCVQTLYLFGNLGFFKPIFHGLANSLLGKGEQ